MKSVLGDRKAILILLGPALLLYTAVMLIPMVWSFVLTFFDGTPLRGFEPAGFANYAQMFQDQDLLDAFWFTVKYAVLVTIGQVVFGYLLALLYLFVLRRSSAIVRTLVFFPVVLPTVAISLLYQKLFQSAPRDGLVNELLVNVGLDGIDWLGSGTTGFIVIVIMDIWRSMGFYGVLLFSGLLDIPEDVIESARIDGARGLGMFRHIVLPMSLPVLYASIIFSINGTIKVFDSVFALTNGGPGDETTPLTLYMYRSAFTYNDYGYGSTVAMLLTIMCLIVTLLIFRSSRSDNTV